MLINVIAAVADNNAIGRDNALLWHISEDLKYFKKMTYGLPVIMGRRTFESLGRPLPGRLNIVVTRKTKEMSFPEGVVAVSSLEEAFAAAEESQLCESKQCFIIGGGQIYFESLAFADRLYITEVHTCVSDADVFFPAVDRDLWEEVSRSQTMTDIKSGLSFNFVVYNRKP